MNRMTSSRERRVLRAGLVAVAAVFALAACEPKTAIRGHMPRDSKLSQVQVGQDDKRRIRELLGSPSTVGTFEDDAWYYMSRRTEQWAFFEPTIVNHRILALRFDGNGVLREMKTYTEEDLREIDYAERETPTSGRQLSFFEQLFGGIGGVKKN